MSNKKKLIKKVSFSYITKGHIGFAQIEVNCRTKDDLKEALNFATRACTLIPQVRKEIKP